MLARLVKRSSGICPPNLQTLPGLALLSLLQRGFADDSTPEADELQVSQVEAGLEQTREASSEASSEASGSVDTEEWRPASRKGRRPTRQEKGSWVNNVPFMDELVESSPIWPENEPLYDIATQAPWLTEPQSNVLDAMKRIRETNPEFLEELLADDDLEEDPPYPGARKILNWEVRMVLSEGPNREPHPANKKVKCRVYLRDLQQERRLSDAALQHIALIAGPRYNPNKGELTLTSEKYPQREENRLHIMEMLSALVEEGHRAYPNAARTQDMESDNVAKKRNLM